jgi:adenosylmethionine-8-amino-7-oxononanoate aminotransferase
LQYGSTYNGHPVALSSAYAVVKYMLQHRVIEHAAAMQTHMEVRLGKRGQSFSSQAKSRRRCCYGNM